MNKENKDNVPANLSNRVIKGLSWTLLNYILNFLAQFLGLIILTRLLSPADFGIYAIGILIVGIGNSVFAMGLGPALIQKSGPVEDYIDPAWTSNLFMSAFSMLLLLITAPFIVTRIFNSPEAIFPVLVLLSVVLISGLNNMGVIYYYRNINMSKWFWMNAPTKVIGIAGSITFAFFYPSVWALVFGYVLQFSLQAIVSYIIYPRTPRIKIDLKKFKELYSFGGWLQLKNIVKWIAKQADSAVVGNLLGTVQLGLYNRAITIARLPDQQINSVVDVIIFPMFSEIKEKKDKIRVGFKASFDLTALIVFPLILCVVLFGEEIIRYLLGDRWILLTFSFQVLTVAISLEALLESFFPLLRALGYPRNEFMSHTIKIVVMSVLLYPLTVRYQIVGTAFSIFAGVIVAFPIILYRVIKIANISWREWLVTFFVCSISILILFPLIYFFKQYSSDTLISLILSVLLVLAGYMILLFMFNKLFFIGPMEIILRAIKTLRKKLK